MNFQVSVIKDKDESKLFNYSALISIFYKESPSYLEKSLDSISNQSFKPSEIIIIKDGVFPKPLEATLNSFIKRNKGIDIKTINHKSPLGLARSLNEGIKISCYTYIARFDSDDISLKDRILVQSKLITQGNYSVIGSNVMEFTDSSNIRNLKKVPETSSQIDHFMKRRNPLNHMSVIFNKKDIIDVGCYDEVSYFEDYILWAKVAANGGKMRNIQKPLVYARTEQNFIDRRSGKKYALAEIKLQQKLYKLKIINRFEEIENILSRSLIRILPRPIIETIYRLLRN